jgi:hypothetical protein
MRGATSVLLLLAALFASTHFCGAQNAHSPLPSSPQIQDLRIGGTRPNPTANGLGDMPGVPAADDVQKQQAMAANRQRQIEIRRDTEKMLQLTMELKDDLQQADHVLSLDAIKKAEQIEKLAKSVRSKMKTSF